MKKIWETVLLNVVIFDEEDVIRTSKIFEGEIDNGNSSGNSDWEGEMDWTID